jgi:hybrid cluster-associated redox disulfide protein
MHTFQLLKIETSAMPKQLITLDHFIDEILNQWPETIKLFLDYRMACVGCSMSSFDTLRDALAAHDLPQDVVLHALNASVKTASSPNGNSR